MPDCHFDLNIILSIDKMTRKMIRNILRIAKMWHCFQYSPFTRPFLIFSSGATIFEKHFHDVLTYLKDGAKILELHLPLVLKYSKDILPWC